MISQYEETKQKNLQDRMNPHFLFNALHTIHALLRSDIQKADKAIIMLSEIYRFLFDKHFNSLVTFDEEWQFLKNYLEFEKLRFPDILSFKLDKLCNFDDVSIPPLTIQPIVENSIRHGLREKKGSGFVKISAKRNQDEVMIEVLDNGVGIKTQDLFSGTLGNIKDRLIYHFDKVSIKLKNRKEGGVKVDIFFKLYKGIIQ